MASLSGDSWADRVGQFVDAHYGSITGKARLYVIDQNLALHLPAPPGRVLDVGGGAGNQSIPLARRGYEVTILDPSRSMLQRAGEVLESEPPDVAGRVTLVPGRGQDAPRLLAPGSYGAVLCHGVLMYLDDSAPLVSALATMVATGGIVSVVTKNRATLAIGPARRGDWKAAHAAFNATGEVNRLGLETRAETVNEVESLFTANGIKPIEWFGVRLFTDHWEGPEPMPEAEPDILAVELMASRRDPYRGFSRLFHVVGRKQAQPEGGPEGR